jgi:sugar/nucleoside kinase (ribokinase family)
MAPASDAPFLDSTARFGERSAVTIGQVSVDQVIVLDGALALGDQSSGTFASGPGGTAAIVAHNLAALGGRASFAGHAGSDASYDQALRALGAAGVVCDDVLREPSGLRVIVLVEPGGSRTMISNGARVDWTKLDQAFPRGGITYFEGWHLFDPETVGAYVALIERCAAEGSSVVLDVCSATRAADPDAHAALLRRLPIDLLLANEDEAEAFDLIADPPARSVIVHRERRSTLLVAGGSIQEFAPKVVPAVDTTGAGDTFAAGVLRALQRDEPLDVAIEWGHAAARRVVRRVGPLLPASRPSAAARRAG